MAQCWLGKELRRQATIWAIRCKQGLLNTDLCVQLSMYCFVHRFLDMWVLIYFLFSQNSIKLSPLPGFEPGTAPVASRRASHWVMTIWFFYGVVQWQVFSWRLREQSFYLVKSWPLYLQLWLKKGKNFTLWVLLLFQTRSMEWCQKKETNFFRKSSIIQHCLLKWNKTGLIPVLAQPKHCVLMTHRLAYLCHQCLLV